jgi:hypothetical protein
MVRLDAGVTDQPIAHDDVAREIGINACGADERSRGDSRVNERLQRHAVGAADIASGGFGGMQRVVGEMECASGSPVDRPRRFIAVR